MNLEATALSDLEGYDWELVTFRNSVHFHWEALLRIQAGENPVTAIPEDNTRRGLLTRGVLRHTYTRAGRVVTLTDRAINQLKEGDHPKPLPLL